MLNLHMGLAGRFTLRAVKPDGSSRLLADWFDNLILDQGLNRMGTGAFMSSCVVGAGSTDPTTIDTALESYIAGTSTIHSSSYGAQPTAPYYGWLRYTYRFAQGTAAGNIGEVGVGWATTDTPTLFSRARIKDELGDPTVVTVLADEFLDVTYELRSYPPTVDGTPVVLNIDGVNYTFTPRAMVVTSITVWSPDNQAVGLSAHGGSWASFLHSGAIGAITSSPSGTSGHVSGQSNLEYSNNSLQRDMLFYWDLDYGNVPGGAQAVTVGTTLGDFQLSISPALPKTSLKVLSMTFRVTWARKV